MLKMRVENSLPLGISEFHERALRAFQVYGKNEAAQLRSYMKINRPWTDRSNDAKNRLDCKYEQYEDVMRYTLSQGVHYGIWLEMAHEKRFAILEPTVRLRGPEVIQNMQGLLDKMGGM